MFGIYVKECVGKIVMNCFGLIGRVIVFDCDLEVVLIFLFEDGEGL